MIMIKRIVLCIWALVLPILAGCGSTPEITDCLHTQCVFLEAIPSGFLLKGTLAHYQCPECGAKFDSRMSPVGDLSTPVLSPEVTLCIDGQPVPLTLESASDTQINWSVQNLTLSKGAVITLFHADHPEQPLTYSPQGILDSAGCATEGSLNASVSLVATADTLTLFVLDGAYPGVVALINNEEFPMTRICSAEFGVDTYSYGFVFLEAGDLLSVVDNLSGFSYGYADLDPDTVWNEYAFHCGEDGILVIDQPGCYRLDLITGQEKTIALTQVFSPESTSSCAVVFTDDPTGRFPMEATLLAQDGQFQWYTALETTGNKDVFSAFIDKNTLQSYDIVLTMEAGTRFRIETDSGLLAAQRLTEVIGDTDCVLLNGSDIQIHQTGAYHIRYLPFSGSISLRQLPGNSIREAAALFDRQVAAIPSGAEITFGQRIKSLYQEYQALEKVYRPYLKTLNKLETLYQNLQKAEAAPIIYHINTPSGGAVYPSKAALCDAFYRDFYYYIAVFHGTEQLQKNGIDNVAEFVELAQDFNGAGMTDLYGIGYIAGIYFLESRANNILENQSENGFLGFCYQNGLYDDLIPFLTNYFAYWRIDEGYAKSDNRGADLFAEAWAPTVDIAKFFYYDENTSYVKTDRVLDCFTNTACVVYGLDSGHPLPQITLRGYLFEGWYDNPDFLGSPLTEIPQSEAPIRLYAKWRTDQAQQDRDNANLVDVYIHNLNTKRANRSQENIGYVIAMYDALSPEAKALVQKYDLLAALAG